MGEKWKDFSRKLRENYQYCQWCGIHYTKTKTGYLECHHIGHRGYRASANQEYRLCPFNIIVVCQSCHVMLEPFAKIRVQLIFNNNLGEEVNEVKCCGMGSSCARFRKQDQL